MRASTIKPSHDLKARAEFLAMAGGGGFLLYLHMHDPDDMAAVLRDYGKEMILPALEIYAHGLLTDATMYNAFVAKRVPEKKSASEGPVTGD